MAATLSPVKDRFTNYWGEMGTKWGVSRTVGHVHALVYVSPDPLNAEGIAPVLAMARSIVSNSLRELESWGLIKPARVRGDRRQHFEGVKDVWEMFRIILDERRRREIDPTRQCVRGCLAEARTTTPGDSYTIQRLTEALQFFDVMIFLYGQIRQLPQGALRLLAHSKSQAQAVLKEFAKGTAKSEKSDQEVSNVA